MTDYIKFPRDLYNYVENCQLTATRWKNLEETYRNRKGYFSSNVQAVVDPCMEFLDIVAEWPGRAQELCQRKCNKGFFFFYTASLFPLIASEIGLIYLLKYLPPQLYRNLYLEPPDYLYQNVRFS